jgi:hypothetical protein
MSINRVGIALAGVLIVMVAKVGAEGSKQSSPPDVATCFEVYGPGLTVGSPRTKILDSTSYSLERCLRECCDGTHGACVAATFHRGNECKLFSSYKGIERSDVRDKVTYVKR